MARQKNPTALFDVIHSAKKPPKASPSAALPTPKWWGKGRKLPKNPVLESTEKVGKQKSWLTRAKENAASSAPLHVAREVVDHESTVQASEPSVPVEESAQLDRSAEILPAVAAEPKPRFIDRFVNRAAMTETAVHEINTDLSIPESTDDVAYEPQLKPDVRPSRTLREPAMRLDSAGGDIKFRLSYAAVIAVVFIFAVSLAIAFVAGRQSASSSQTAFDDDFAGGSKGTATTLPSSYGMSMAVGPVTADNPPEKVSAHPDVLTVPSHPAKPQAINPQESAVHNLLPINKKSRTIGMIYVIVQSYAEKDLAQKACDFMNAQGVDCTVVQGPSHWALPDWYSVVSMQPFNKHDAELPDFEKAVRGLGVKFTNRVLDQFQPQGYTWRADSDLSQQ